jgi:hypothetical protein
LFDDNGNIAGNAQFTFNKLTGQVNAGYGYFGGLESGSGLIVPGNANIGNMELYGVFISTGNIFANTGLIQSNTVNANLITGTLTTNAQPNITSVGTLVNVSVTGNVLAGNVYANSGIIRGFNINGNTGGFTGNVTANNIVSNLARGNSNISIFANAGNIGMSVNGTANIVTVSTDGANITGNINANTSNISGNITAGNISAASGNIQANIILGNSVNSSSFLYFSESIELLASNIKLKTASTDRLVLNATEANFSVPIEWQCYC